MKFFQVLSTLVTATVVIVGYASAQHQQSQHQQYSPGTLGAYSSAPISTTPRPLPPAQVHYVNIGEDLTGDYKFGYDTGKNDGGQSFREEARLPDGTVKGAYGYIDSEGKQRIVKYTAGTDGFKVESDEAVGGPSAPRPSQASYQLPQNSQPLGGYSPVARSAGGSIHQQQAPAPAAPLGPRLYSPRPQNSQPLGGYSPVSPATTFSPAPNPQYRQAPAPISSAPPSPLPNYSAALQAQLQALQAGQYSSTREVSSPTATLSFRPAPTSSVSYQPSSSISYQPAQPSPQTQSITSAALSQAYGANLAQRQPTLANVQQGRPAHLASIPRGGSPSLASYGSSFGNVNEPLQESTTWGPPVINKELLSYNIGVGRR